MKFFVTLCTFIFTVISVGAQTAKGGWMFGGSFGLQHSMTTAPDFTQGTLMASKVTTINLNPTVGYFPINNLLVGIQTAYSHSGRADKNFTSNTYGAGPMFRYYFRFGKFGAFPEVAAIFSETDDQNRIVDGTTGFTVTDRYKVNTYRANACIVWFVKPSVGIEGVIGYRRINNKMPNVPNDTKESDVYFNIGLQFYLSKKN